MSSARSSEGLQIYFVAPIRNGGFREIARSGTTVFWRAFGLDGRKAGQFLFHLQNLTILEVAIRAARSQPTDLRQYGSITLNSGAVIQILAAKRCLTLRWRLSDGRITRGINLRGPELDAMERATADAARAIIDSQQKVAS